MVEEKDLEKIKKTAREFLEKMDFEAEITVSKMDDKTVFLSMNMKTDDPKILIGQSGQTLNEIQHLLRAILRRKVSEEIFLDLDINEYKKKKIEYLKETANYLADEVALTKKEKILEPMPAYERRIIHLELSQRKDIRTESIGEEPERKIVIKSSY